MLKKNNKIKFRWIKLVILPAFFISCDSSFVKSKTEEESISELTLKLEDDSLNASIYWSRALLFEKQEKFTPAFKDGDKAFKLAKTNLVDLLKISDWAFKIKNIEAQRKYLKLAYSSDQLNTDILINLAQIDIYLGEYQNAIISLNKALKIDRYIDQAYFMKGVCYKLSKDTVKANSSMLTATEINPNNFQAFYELGLLNLNNELGVKYLNNAKQISPNDIFVLEALGWYYQSQKNWQASKKEYLTLIRNYPNKAKGYYNLGTVYLNENKFDSAKVVLERARSLNPNNINVHFNLGIVYQANNETPLAIESYELCLKLDSSFSPAKQSLNKLKN